MEIKAYTDLEQSKKLSEILPIESADMCYIQELLAGCKYGEYKPYIGNIIPAYGQDKIRGWSLSALLDILPKFIDFGMYYSFLQIYPIQSLGWVVEYSNNDNNVDFSFDDKNLIDVIYEMILKLNELNML